MKCLLHLCQKMLLFQPTTQDALQQHAKHPGIWKAMQDSIGASSDLAKRRLHLKGRFEAVFKSGQAFTQCTGLEMHASKAAYPELRPSQSQTCHLEAAWRLLSLLDEIKENFSPSSVNMGSLLSRAAVLPHNLAKPQQHCTQLPRKFRNNCFTSNTQQSLSTWNSVLVFSPPSSSVPHSKKQQNPGDWIQTYGNGGNFLFQILVYFMIWFLLDGWGSIVTASCWMKELLI